MPFSKKRRRPSGRAPSDGLARFLAAEDLDDLVRIALKLRQLSANDMAVVREVIEDWRPQQAIANLLIHPGLIPPETRGATIIRGLTDHDRPYLKLAATVGLTSIEPSDVPARDAAVIRDRLCELLEDGGSIISERASVSIEEWLDSASASAVCRLLKQLNETAAHNVLAWLIRHIAPVELVLRLNACDLPPEQLRSAMKDIDEFARCREAGVTLTRATTYFLAYIPNLSEFRQD